MLQRSTNQSSHEQYCDQVWSCLDLHINPTLLNVVKPGITDSEQSNTNLCTAGKKATFPTQFTALCTEYAIETLGLYTDLHCVGRIAFYAVTHIALCNPLSLTCNKPTSRAHSSVRWCSHCGCGYCPRPSSSALCLPCAADCCCCGCGELTTKAACHAPGDAHDSGDGHVCALWCYRETPRHPRLRTRLLSWYHPQPRNCHCDHCRRCSSLAPPAGRL